MYGGWSIDKNAIDFIKSTIAPGSTIIELGSGSGTTKSLCGTYNLYSVEHDIKYLGKYNSRYIYTPLINNYWYDRNILKRHMPKKYDLIIVDGPIGHRRMGFIDNYDLFNQETPILIDDTNRDVETKMLEILIYQYGKKIVFSSNGILKTFSFLDNQIV